MVPVLVFFVVAVLVGGLIRGGVELRRRPVARRPDATDAEICQLDQATRISTLALVTSLIGVVIIGAVYLVV